MPGRNMTDDAKSGGGPPAAPSRINRFGRRNVGYILFVALLIPSGIAMEASGPRGPDAGGGIMFALFAWGIVSGLFFLTNRVLAAVQLRKGRPPRKRLAG